MTIAPSTAASATAGLLRSLDPEQRATATSVSMATPGSYELT
jgi:hypothetical protein